MIYLDANATTPLHPAVLAAMQPLFGEVFGNPSSLHLPGQKARAALDGARERCAAALRVDPGEIVFTSGGTESAALAIQGVVRAAIASGRVADPARPESARALDSPHLVTTAVEHPAVKAACDELRRQGVAVTRVAVDREGRLDLGSLARALEEPGTILCTAMAANNETGVLFPIAAIGALCRARGVLLHVDAVQWAGKEDFSLPALPVDLLSLSAHKLQGPKGAGLLWARRGVQLEAVQRGGPQERGRRAGTENVAAIVGLAEALARAQTLVRDEAVRLRALRDRLEQAVGRLPGARVVGSGTERLCNTVCAVFEECEGETLLAALDLEGIAVSTGSACSSGTLAPSPVLQAMGFSPELARAALRFSLWSGNREEEIERVCKILPRVVARIRTAPARPATGAR